MRNISDKTCREKQKTHKFNNFSFKNHAVYEIILKNMLQPDRPQMVIRLMPVACWIPKAAATLEPKPTQQSKPTCLGKHRQTGVATFNPTCRSKLLAAKGLLVPSLLIVSDVNGT